MPGKHETKDITAEGRLLFDLLRVTEMEHKLSSSGVQELRFSLGGKAMYAKEGIGNYAMTCVSKKKRGFPFKINRSFWSGLFLP